MILNRLCQLACRIMMEVYVCKCSQLHLSPFRWSHGLPLEKSWLLVFLDSTWRICLYLFLFFPTSKWWKIHQTGYIFIWRSSAYGMQMEEGSSSLHQHSWCLLHFLASLNQVIVQHSLAPACHASPSKEVFAYPGKQGKKGDLAIFPHPVLSASSVLA